MGSKGRRLARSVRSPDYLLWYNRFMDMKKLDYLIKLTYDKNYKGYVADVVNLYGCMSQGKTKKEALENIEKAIKAYMEAVAKKEKNTQFTKKSVNVDIPHLSLNV